MTTGTPSGSDVTVLSHQRSPGADFAELAEQVVIREGEVTLRITRKRALLKSLVAKAMKGDAKMARLLVDICEKQSAAEDADTVSDDDERFIGRLVAEKVDSEGGDG